MKSPSFIRLQKKPVFLSLSIQTLNSLKSLIRIICLSLLFYSCDKKITNSESYNEVLNIDPSLASNYDIDEIFEEFDFLKLENGGRLVGSVDKVLFAKSRYFILDKDYTNGLYVFDEQGGYINQIGNEGDGPTDYGDINDFTIVTVGGSQQVWILDNVNSYFSISKYDLNGSFIEKTRSTLMADFMDYLPSGNLIFSTSNQCNDNFCNDLFTTDLNLNLISKANKPTTIYEKFWFEPSNPISVSQTTASAVSYGHTKIVKTDPQTGVLLNDIKIDFGSHKVSSDLIENYYSSIEGFLVEANRERVCHLIDDLFHTDQNLFFSFKYGSKEYYYLKNDTHNTGLIIKNIIFNVGVDLLLPLNVVGAYDNTLLVLLGSEELLEFYKNHRAQIEKQSGPFQSLLNNITDSSNPIIVKLKFK